MKKYIISLTIIGVAVLTLLACKPKENNSPAGTDEKQVTSTTTLVAGKPVTDNQFLPIEDLQYSNDTLPEEHYNTDFDGDGLSNLDETKHNTDMYKSDTDGDGISDTNEINQTQTDPTKYSTRDDGVSDLDWWFSQADGFSAGWNTADGTDYKVYLKVPADRIYALRKMTTNAFDGYETITEVYQVSGFTGKMALNCAAYSTDIQNGIGIYIMRGDDVMQATTTIENGMVVFDVEANDMFVAIYIG